MRKFLITLAAGAATVAFAGVASAEQAKTTSADQPIVLTTDQMDGVTAGDAAVSATLTGDAIVDGSFHLDNLPGVFSEANISASIRPFSGVPVLVLTAHADTDD
jgi:hypothetical protein